MRGGEAHVGEYVGFVRATIDPPERSLHALTVPEGGELRHLRPEVVGDDEPPTAGGLGVVSRAKAVAPTADATRRPFSAAWTKALPSVDAAPLPLAVRTFATAASMPSGASETPQFHAGQVAAGELA